MTNVSVSHAVENAVHIPEPITATLRQVVRRLRLLVLFRGSLAVVAVTVGALLAVMGIDAAVTILASEVRWALTGVVFLAAAATLAWFVIRPLAHSFTMTGIARLIETHHPELEERISSAIELLSSSDAPELRGSEALIAQLTGEASVRIRVVEPRREFSLRVAGPRLLAAAAAVAALASVFALWPRDAGQLLLRALIPYADLGNVGSLDMTVTPGDVVLPRGTPLRVDLSVANATAQTADLRRLGPGGLEAVLPMVRTAPGSSAVRQFTLTVPSGDSDFRYRVLTGSKLSRYYDATVTPRPDVERLDLRYDYPSYTKVPARTESPAPGDIAAVLGTTVTATATINKPLASAQMLVNGKAVPDADLRTEGDRSVCSWRVPVEAPGEGTWSLVLTDRYNLKNSPIEHKIAGVRDQKPTLAVTWPTETKLVLRPDERLPVEYIARDDFGIAGTHFIVTIEDKPLAPIALGLPAPSPVEKGAWTGRAVLNLASLDLRGVTRLTFQLRVNDALPPALSGPQYAFSKVFEVQINAGNPTTYTERNLLANADDIRKALTSVLADLQQAKTDSAQLTESVGRTKQLTPQQNAMVDKLRAQTGSAEAKLHDLADKVENTEFAELKDKTAAVADKHVTPARKAADALKLTDEPKDRTEQAKAADEHVEKAIADVQAILGDLGDLADRIRIARKIAELAEREKELAAAAKNRADEKKTDPADAKWQKDQQRLTDDLARAVRQNPDALRDALKDKGEEAKSLANEAGKLADQQKDLKDLTDKATAPPTADDLKKELLNRVTEAQKEIARETAETAAETDKEVPQAKSEHNKAAKSTQQTVGELEKNDLNAAAKTSEQAAGQLDNTARELADAAEGADQEAADNPENGDAAQKNAQNAENGQPNRTKQPESGEQARAAGELSKKAGELAERQKNVAGQIKALAEGDLDKALALMQQDVAERAKELANDAREMQQETGDLAAGSEQKNEEGERAAGELARASEKAADAARQLGAEEGNHEGEHERQAGEHSGQGQPEQQAGEHSGQGKPEQQAGEHSGQGQPEQQAGEQNGQGQPEQQAGEHSGQGGKPEQSASNRSGQGHPSEASRSAAAANQQQAAEALANAAKALGEMSKALGQQAGNVPGRSESEPGPASDMAQSLAQALDHASNAAHAPNSAQAAESSQSAAQSLSEASQAASQQAGMPSQQATQTNSGPSHGARSIKFVPGSDAKIPDRLKELGIKAADWARLSGELRDQILQAADERTPEEYRALVKRYFRELARRGSGEDKK